MTKQSITSAMRAAIDSAPEGTSGLVIEPWSPAEVYGVAADWSQASATVYRYGRDSWEPTQWQVADSRHRARPALERELAEVLVAGGDDEDDAADLVDDATEF